MVMTEKMRGTQKTSPSSKLPARSPKAASSLFRKIPHDSKKGQDLNIKFVLAMLSSSVSFNILDNPEWAVFLETLSNHQYNVHCCAYMNGRIVPLVYGA